MSEVLIVVIGLTVCGLCTEATQRFVDIMVTGWFLKRQGLSEKERHSIIAAKARRQRQNLLIQVFKLITQLRHKSNQ